MLQPESRRTDAPAVGVTLLLGQGLSQRIISSGLPIHLLTGKRRAATRLPRYRKKPFSHWVGSAPFGVSHNGGESSCKQGPRYLPRPEQGSLTYRHDLTGIATAVALIFVLKITTIFQLLLHSPLASDRKRTWALIMIGYWPFHHLNAEKAQRRWPK